MSLLSLTNDKIFEKFLYELKHRKKEFLKECITKDFQYNSSIDVISFREILDSFTHYLESEEKDVLQNKVMTDGKVQYLNLVNRSSAIQNFFEDALLQHLNEKDSDHSKNLISITNLENKLKEENFIINIAKKILDFFLKNSPYNQEEKYLRTVLKKYDYDDDNMYSIGELKNFLLFCEIELVDADLRYLYEYLLDIEKKSKMINKRSIFNTIISVKNDSENFHGKFSVNNFSNFILDYYKKEFNKIKNKTNYKTDYEIKEEKNLRKILLNCKFIKILLDSLAIFGKEYLKNYFAQYIKQENNDLFIELIWLEIGYKNMGYEEPSSSDMGNFKYFCLKKNFATMKSIKDVIIHLDLLFNFLIEEFKINTDLNEDNHPYKSCEILFNDIVSIITSKLYNESSITSDLDEISFRKKFSQNFGFTDQLYMNFLSALLDSKFSDNLDKNLHRLNTNKDNFSYSNINKFTEYSKILKLKYISHSKWIQLCFNFIFIGIVENLDRTGLILDFDDLENLEIIKKKIKDKLFPIFDKKKIKYEEMRESKVSQTQLNNKNDVNTKSINIKNLSEEKVLFKSLDTTENKNCRKIIYKDRSINSENVIPEIFTKCHEFLSSKYNIGKNELATSIDCIASLGICSLFREAILNKGFTNRIDYFALLELLKKFNFSNEANKFFCIWLKKIAIHDNNITQNYIQLNDFYKKLEDILLDYARIKSNIIL